MREKHHENARVFKAFCDETRLQVLELLQSGEKCACILLDRVHVGQSTLSHHMKILVESGIVTARREGKWTYYALSPVGCRHARDLLERLTKVTDQGEIRDVRCG